MVCRIRVAARLRLGRGGVERAFHFPVRLKVQNIDGVEGLYGPSDAEYFWIAIGAVIGLVGVSFIGVAVIAKGIQIGGR